MNLFAIVCRNLRQHALSTSVTAASIALACGLLMSVWAIKDEVSKTFSGMDLGFDAVLGVRSSQLQLVLNAVFHLETSPGNLESTDLAMIRQEPVVKLAIPLALGDSYQGYRVAGTVPELFTKHELRAGKKLAVQSGGRLFDPTLREAVIGSVVAERLNLRVGEEFHPSHGVDSDEHEHEDHYLIVGLLEPTGTPADRVIWIPLEGLQKMSGHAEAAHTQISAVLLKFTSPMAGRTLQMKYNRPEGRFTLAGPIGTVVAQLINRIAWFEQVLKWVAVLVALVATGSILASIYNSMEGRRREIAVFRALGARRRTVLGMVVLESALIAMVGALVGFVVYFVLMSAVAQIVRARTGVLLDPFALRSIFWIAPLGIVAISALVGIVPGLKAYRTDVVNNLSPMS